MVTKAELEEMRGGGYLYHNTKTDSIGEPLKARLNGKMQIWKTRPHDFRQSAKYGLYQYFDITHENAYEWKLS